jgi:hypothetical protein
MFARDLREGPGTAPPAEGPQIPETNFAERIARVAGAVIGLGLVAAVVLAVRPAGGHGGVLPAHLRFTVAQDGAIAAAPAAPKPLLASGPLRPGSRAAATMRLRNQTGERLFVRLRARPDSTALDGTARVRLSGAGRTLAAGTLESLRAGSAGAIALAPGAGAAVRVTAWIPADTETGYEGASVGVVLEPVEEAGR